MLLVCKRWDFFAPLQNGQLQLFYCCKFTPRRDNHRLLLYEESVSCFLPCVSLCEWDPSWSGLAVSSCEDCITLILCGNNHTNTQCLVSVHVQQTLHWFYHTKRTNRNHYAIIINLFYATLYSIRPCLSFWSHVIHSTDAYIHSSVNGIDVKNRISASVK